MEAATETETETEAVTETEAETETETEMEADTVAEAGAVTEEEAVAEAEAVMRGPEVRVVRARSWMPTLDVVVRRYWRDHDSPDETVVLVALRWN